MTVFGQLDEVTRSRVIELLNRRLEPADLRAVLDHEKKAVQEIVVQTEPGSRRGRPRTRLQESELAEFLVNLFGPSLLEGSRSVRGLRFRLVKRATADELDQLETHGGKIPPRGSRDRRAKAVADRRWHSGKSWARHFVRTLDLPPVLAGLPGATKEPDHLDVLPFRPLRALEDFQTDLRNAALKVLDSPAGDNRAVLSLPTGAGKTRTAVESLLEWHRSSPHDRPSVLWIAQSEELCEQAVQSFRDVWIDLGHRDSSEFRPLGISRFWGADREVPKPDETHVVVASIQKLLSAVRGSDDERRSDLKELRDSIGAVIVDEVHRITATSYSEVLSFLGIDTTAGKRSTTPLLGLTATPFRGNDDETRRLNRIFHGKLLRSPVLGEQPIGTLRARGVLAQARHEVLEPIEKFDLDGRSLDHFRQFNDFDSGFLDRVSRSRNRNQQILERVLGVPEKSPTLFFGCSVEHAEAMCVLLRRAGRSAEVVTGETRSATRRSIIEEFRTGNISVLCNYGVLTTGFDAPKVETLVIGRPTTSRVLYEQMIGRGMRGPEFGGTGSCRVIDVHDNIRFHGEGELAFHKYGDYWS
jgi:superfamily II DNA or RNA helicase